MKNLSPFQTTENYSYHFPVFLPKYSMNIQHIHLNLTLDFYLKIQSTENITNKAFG